MNFTIEALAARHERVQFDCGEPSLNDYLRLYSWQNDKRGLGKTYVATVAGEVKVYGFYTISSSSIDFSEIPENLPRYPIPVVHLGRLAVDNGAQGHGLGSLLLIDAMRRSIKLAEQLGIYAVEIYALNDTARNFYSKFGFQALKDDKHHLYMSVKKISKLDLS